jgi:glutamine amidotransferase
VRTALTAVGAHHFTPQRPGDIDRAAGIVIPGVGHFSATRALVPEWRAALLAAAGRGTPLLGICLGMQYLFDGSDEAPAVPGLGLLSGACTRLPAGVKVPPVGWNDFQLRRPSRLLAAAGPGGYAYFTHSYAAAVTDDCVATTEYAGPFASVVERGHVFGVQFHPEKSSRAGLEALRAFLTISRSPDSIVADAL